MRENASFLSARFDLSALEVVAMRKTHNNLSESSKKAVLANEVYLPTEPADR
jgi:hypothetical protein